jgi:putative two-component system response regulator
VSDIAVILAKEMGLPPEIIDTLRVAGLVHDIGKIGVRELVLSKPTHLTEEELQHVQKHPDIGEHILIPIAGNEELLKMVRGHHEHYDGTGYPDGLKGSRIPLGARILAVTDAYDAMTSARPYREMLSEKEAFAELERYRGSQFDPVIVDAFFHSKKSWVF